MRARVVADVLGGMGSAICAVDCLAAPFLLLAGPLVPSVLLPDAQFHEAMRWLVGPTSGLAFLLGCRRHEDRPTILLAVFGLVALLLGGTSLHARLGETGERLVTMLAGCLLVAAHIRNFTLCRSDHCEHTS